MMRRTWLTVGTVAPLWAGCSQSTPPSAPVAAVNRPPGASARQAARVLAQRGDWAGAVVKNREALRAEPEDVQLHLALGSALSRLDRHEEATEQFRGVGAGGRPSVPEERYRLMAQEGRMRLLDTSVQVAAGKEAVLDLAADASSVSPRDFPRGGPKRAGG